MNFVMPKRFMDGGEEVEEEGGGREGGLGIKGGKHRIRNTKQRA